MIKRATDDDALPDDRQNFVFAIKPTSHVFTQLVVTASIFLIAPWPSQIAGDQQ